MGLLALCACVAACAAEAVARGAGRARRGARGVDPRLPGCLIACRRRTGCLKTDVTRSLFVAEMLVLLAAAVRAVKAHEESSLETSRTSPREISPLLYLVYLRIYHCTYAGDAFDRLESQS